MGSMGVNEVKGVNGVGIRESLGLGLGFVFCLPSYILHLTS